MSEPIIKSDIKQETDTRHAKDIIRLICDLSCIADNSGSALEINPASLYALASVLEDLLSDKFTNY